MATREQRKHSDADSVRWFEAQAHYTCYLRDHDGSDDVFEELRRRGLEVVEGSRLALRLGISSVSRFGDQASAEFSCDELVMIVLPARISARGSQLSRGSHSSTRVEERRCGVVL